MSKQDVYRTAVDNYLREANIGRTHPDDTYDDANDKVQAVIDVHAVNDREVAINDLERLRRAGQDRRVDGGDTGHDPLGRTTGMIDVPAGYENLFAVLTDAFNQAAYGKGKDRHAKGAPFDEQRMQTISSLIGSDKGMEYQAIKKLTEGLDMSDPQACEKELLGAIVYIAGIIIWRKSQE